MSNKHKGPTVPKPTQLPPPPPKDQANEQVPCSPNQCVDQSATEGTGPNNADRSEALLPCPWCNSTDIDSYDSRYARRFGLNEAIRCKSCGAVGPKESIHHKMGSIWNFQRARQVADELLPLAKKIEALAGELSDHASSEGLWMIDDRLEDLHDLARKLLAKVFPPESEGE